MKKSQSFDWDFSNAFLKEYATLALYALHASSASLSGSAMSARKRSDAALALLSFYNGILCKHHDAGFGHVE